MIYPFTVVAHTKGHLINNGVITKPASTVNGLHQKSFVEACGSEIIKAAL
jgi:hypothetical protein